ncbi:MAG TPA: hypothetical protein DCX89_05275, partial [Saprospirales bacterium]|nr:hypothetical protein [Saprospirales bacterium]
IFPSSFPFHSPSIIPSSFAVSIMLLEIFRYQSVSGNHFIIFLAEFDFYRASNLKPRKTGILRGS